MSGWQKSTIAIIIGTVVFLGVYDVIALIGMGHFFGQDTNPTIGDSHG